MQKFSKIQKEVPVADQPTNSLWKGSHIEVLSVDGWEIISEKDMVVALPYFIERNEVLVRAEDIPTYALRTPGHSKFLTLMSGTMETGETADATLRRELLEECGIKLSDRYKPTALGSFMISKGHTAKYHIFVLPLMENDYEQLVPKTDGTKSEKKSGNVRVSTSKVRNMQPNDLVTAYTLGAFLSQHKLSY